MCGDMQDAASWPSRDTQDIFYRAYLKALGEGTDFLPQLSEDNDANLKRLYQEVIELSQASYLYWGFWVGFCF